jgi:NADPH-dependent ferric siderophore reductase
LASLRTALGNLVAPILFRATTVARVEQLAPGLRRLTLQGEDLKKLGWQAGDKVQLMLPGMVARTYSPFDVDTAAGTLKVLAYAHGEGPAAAWTAAAAEGDAIPVFGPRGSLALGSMPGPVVLVGDETSLGVSLALHRHRDPKNGRPADVAAVFELSDAAGYAPALAELGLAHAATVQRQPGKAHLPALEAAVRSALEALPQATLVLTGNARTIQALRAALKARPTPCAGQKTKAYWAAGKKGLD